MGRWASRSFLLSRGRKLFELNSKNWALPMSKWEKLLAGCYIIAKDYSEGRFPPTFDDQAKAYQAEIKYNESLPGVSLDEHQLAHLRKPFWGSGPYQKYSHSFFRLLKVFERLGVKPGSRLLELGCGVGWMAEFLAISGYSVTGTSIAPHDIEIAEKRAEAFRIRGLPDQLSFKVSPMESVDTAVPGAVFDAVFVFEALHHAFDWRAAVKAAHSCLRNGGWMVLANEPNLLHTFISYRVARLSNTHEIGLSRKRLLNEMRRCGFHENVVIAPRPNNRVSPHWIAARK